MAGCLGLFCFSKKKKPDNATSTHEKPSRNTPPLDATTCAAAGSPTQPDVPPAYSRYSGRTVPTWATPVEDGPKSKEESTNNSDEVERRRQAEREEQERRDFFQML